LPLVPDIEARNDLNRLLEPPSPPSGAIAAELCCGLFEAEREGFGDGAARKTHPEMATCTSALPRSFRSGTAQIVPAERCFSCGNCWPESRLFVCCLALLEAGQLEVDGTDFCRSTLMKTFFKAVIWMAAIVAGLVVWNAAPEFRPLVSSILAAAFVCYVLSIIVEVTVKRVISDEQLELRSRLDVLDRKVTAILRDAFERRSPR
jgi:hypothetical protein